MTINYSNKVGFGLPTDGDTNWGQAIRDNYLKIENIISSYQFAEKKETHLNLAFGYHGGVIVINNRVAEIVGGTVALADGVKNFVEAHIDSTGAGKITANQAGFTKYRIPLFEVTTASNAISTVVDRRALNRGVDLTDYDNQIAKANEFPSQLGELSSSHVHTAGAPKFGYNEGSIAIGGRFARVASGSIAITDNATNYIEAYIDSAGAGVVAVNTTGFLEGRIPLYKVTTSSGSFTATVDSRAWLSTGKKVLTSILELTDVPDTFGASGQILKVNAAGNGVEWASDNNSSSDQEILIWMGV